MSIYVLPTIKRLSSRLWLTSVITSSLVERADKIAFMHESGIPEIGRLVESSKATAISLLEIGFAVLTLDDFSLRKLGVLHEPLGWFPRLPNKVWV